MRIEPSADPLDGQCHDRGAGRWRTWLGPDHLIGQAVRFGVTTGISVSVTVGLPVLLHEGFGVAPPVATAVAFVVAFFTNFLTLRSIVFRSAQGIGRDFVTFAGSSLIFRVVEYLAFLLLNVVFGVHYVISLVLILGLSTVSKFFWYRRVIGSPAAGRPDATG